MEIKIEKISIPPECNVIFGQTHFIKTVEDIYEIAVGAVSNIEFGLAFCESSGECLIRCDGNNDELVEAAAENALRISAGHTFILFIKNAFPINLLNAIKNCQEVCNIFCATANPVQVILAETEQGRGVLGVIDGSSPKGIEDENGKKWRYEILRKFGYKK